MYFDFIIDTASAGLAVKPGMLIGGYVYTLRLDMKVYGYTASFTEYTFKTNLPPYGGNCSISPQTGQCFFYIAQCIGLEFSYPYILCIISIKHYFEVIFKFYTMKIVFLACLDEIENTR